jgi:hypothetical protein
MRCVSNSLLPWTIQETLDYDVATESFFRTSCRASPLVSLSRACNSSIRRLHKAIMLVHAVRIKRACHRSMVVSRLDLASEISSSGVAWRICGSMLFSILPLHVACRRGAVFTVKS